MTREKWLEHANATFGILSPTSGGSRDEWNAKYREHIAANCKECKSRAKTRKANFYRKQREQVMRDCGLVKVYGAVTHKVYWE